jgi:hypothetical protein
LEDDELYKLSDKVYWYNKNLQYVNALKSLALYRVMVACVFAAEKKKKRCRECVVALGLDAMEANTIEQKQQMHSDLQPRLKRLHTFQNVGRKLFLLL